jgi:activating signal cointegrator 1
MKALSLWQPHATAIAIGLKRYETRGWSTDYRGPLAIHATKRPWSDVDEWHDEARRRLAAYEREHGAIAWAFGAVVAVVDLADCVPTGDVAGRLADDVAFWGNFELGRFAFRLENVRALPRAVPWRGAQGFFNVDLGATEINRTSGALELFPGGV